MASEVQLQALLLVRMSLEKLLLEQSSRHESSVSLNPALQRQNEGLAGLLIPWLLGMVKQSMVQPTSDQ